MSIPTTELDNIKKSFDQKTDQIEEDLRQEILTNFETYYSIQKTASLFDVLEILDSFVKRPLNVSNITQTIVCTIQRQNDGKMAKTLQISGFLDKDTNVVWKNGSLGSQNLKTLRAIFSLIFQK